MDIRTKLTFVLVGVVLASMMALAAAMYGRADEALRESRLAQLEALAESERDALVQITAAWRDRVALIASRTQLRQTLGASLRAGDPEASERLRRILSDAVESVDIVRSAGVYDTEGRLFASAGDGAEVESLLPLSSSTRVSFQGISYDEDGRPRVDFRTALRLNGEIVGSLRVTMSARALGDLTQDRTGLGESGETMIVARDLDGGARVVRTRTAGSSVELPEPERDESELVRLAVEGAEGRYWRGVTDQRGEAVWAAIRSAPEAGWSVVVKMDADEARAPLVAFRGQLVRLALALAAFAILFATVLALHFAKPIHDLAEVARRLGSGELDARASVSSEDEVGLLARTFNRMADELETQMTSLREFELLFEYSLDMLCIAGTDGYFKRVNPAFERTLGWTEEELLAVPFAAFVHPDDVEKTAREVEKLAAGIPTVSFENRFRCVDGSYRCLLWATHPEPETGLLYAVARDITSLKEEHERFELALQASSTAMIMIDSRGDVVLANQAAEVLFRRERGGLLGESLGEVLPLDVGALVEGPFADYEGGDPGARTRELLRLSARRMDGTEVRLEVELTPIRMARELHVLASLVDVDAREHAEEEIRSLARRLEEAEAQLQAES
ncbi:MAG TPA: PAS domain S-box protein [Longimicrobiales bacterium]|nr:PAS domain S-box protein [Longimicrobiales bacterium]